MARINILGTYIDGDDELSGFRNLHAAWRDTNKNAGVPFYALYEGFKLKELLTDLDAGALRLYLYFGYAANNTYGDSWYSIETIAKYFGKQTRTIDHWIKELVDRELIYRARDDKKSTTTFLIPYSDTLIKIKPAKKHDEDNQGLFDDLVASIRRQEKVYGKIVSIYHLYHWGIGKNSKPVSLGAANFIFIITHRPKNDVLIGHIYQLKKSTNYGISEIDVKESATFDSPFIYGDKFVTGIAVRHTYRLKSRENYDTWINLMRDLVRSDEEILSQWPRLEYGLIDDVLDIQEEAGDNDEQDES
jgi:hypothetical protein